MDFEALLRERGLKVTLNRLDLLKVISAATNPISTKEIELRLEKQPDRVTLYRNLKFFVEKAILSKIEVNESVVTYSFNHNVGSGHPSEEHLHFHCNRCDKVICMPQCRVTKYELPDGFIQQSCKMIVEGVCDKCNSEKTK